MKTEKEYADELIERYTSELRGLEYKAIKCAIIDVTNTIKALDRLGICDTSYYNY